MPEPGEIIDSEHVDPKEKQEQAVARLEGRAREELLERQRREKGELVAAELVPDFAPYGGASQLNLSEVQQKALLAPIPPEELEINPEGMIYLPQLGYRERLFSIFGPGNWALVPMSDPKTLPPINLKQGVDKIVVYQKFQLRIYGKFAAEATGEGDFITSNKGQNKVTAAESSRSNALVRCCKDLGIARECWDKRYAEAWKVKYAMQTGNGWKKKA